MFAAKAAAATLSIRVGLIGRSPFGGATVIILVASNDKVSSGRDQSGAHWRAKTDKIGDAGSEAASRGLNLGGNRSPVRPHLGSLAPRLNTLALQGSRSGSAERLLSCAVGCDDRATPTSAATSR
jgi:hypothetical protein